MKQSGNHHLFHCHTRKEAYFSLISIPPFQIFPCSSLAHVVKKKDKLMSQLFLVIITHSWEKQLSNKPPLYTINELSIVRLKKKKNCILAYVLNFLRGALCSNSLWLKSNLGSMPPSLTNELMAIKVKKLNLKE